MKRAFLLLLLITTGNAFSNTMVVSGNGNGLVDPNECNYLYVVITNQTGTVMTDINATLSSASPHVVVTQPYSTYPNTPGNDKSTNQAPFQISTMPGFVCGSNITLNLALTTASHGAFVTPTTLASGPVCTPGSGPCGLCPNTTLYGNLGQDSSLQSDRLTRDTVVGSCPAPKLCPGGINHGPVFYDAHTFQNGPSNACITVTLTAPTTDLMSVAYLGSFDRLDQCRNYIADSGDSTAQVPPTHPISYSFNVASNATFVVTVNGVDGTQGPYQLSVTGGNCRPVLHVAKALTNNVRLDWPTWAGGYRLESATSLTSLVWTPVSNIAIVVSNRYTVTNSVIGNKFYRLRKP